LSDQRSLTQADPELVDDARFVVAEWWRNAVLYEVYVRSFADSDGDGVGDLEGIRQRLPYLRDLGVEGIWLTPFYPSPGADHGYDVSDYCDVDPQFGTLADFDVLLTDAHANGLRLIVDLVPNHTSIEHPWFHEHPDYYVWRDEPNNWLSVFGGGAWTWDAVRGEYYLHLFAPEQPDLDWHNPAVREEFERIIRFWLDRDVDGFRIDVAHALFKHPELADEEVPTPGDELGTFDRRIAIDRPELHPLYRGWRSLAESYDDDRLLLGEVYILDPVRVAKYVRSDELHLAFNFVLLKKEWSAPEIHAAIDTTLEALRPVGATATWVLESHDALRLPTRYGGGREGSRRARAAALLLLALPGTVFLYQGQELGLQEVDLPDELRQDPVFLRSNGAQAGRDGCRVPIPWSSEGDGLGFTTGSPWLPMPREWHEVSVAAQDDDESSVLQLYQNALAARRESRALRNGSFAWREGARGTLAFERAKDGETMVCAVNVDAPELEVPNGELVLTSERDLGAVLPPGTGAWVREA
jgi:alpha-glucosidase